MSRRLLGRRRLRVHQGGRQDAHESGQSKAGRQYQRERGHAGTHLQTPMTVGMPD